MVGHGRRELADQVAVCRVDVHPVEARLHSAPGATGKGLDRLHYLGFTRRLHHAAGQSVGDRRRRQRTVVGNPRLAACVRDLREHLAAVPVHGARQPGEPGHHRVGVDPDLTRSVAAARMAEHVAAQDQADPVPGQLRVHRNQLVGDLTAFARGRLGGAGTHDPIGDLYRADPTRPPQPTRFEI